MTADFPPSSKSTSEEVGAAEYGASVCLAVGPPTPWLLYRDALGETAWPSGRHVFALSSDSQVYASKPHLLRQAGVAFRMLPYIR
jgi:hypothetical protein